MGDFAEETSNLSRWQVLQQAGTAMLSQNNQRPQSACRLLQYFLYWIGRSLTENPAGFAAGFFCENPVLTEVFRVWYSCFFLFRPPPAGQYRFSSQFVGFL